MFRTIFLYPFQASFSCQNLNVFCVNQISCKIFYKNFASLLGLVSIIFLSIAGTSVFAHASNLSVSVSVSQTRIIAQTQSSGTITNNKITVTGGTITGWVTPAVSYGSANLTYNTVTISGGTFNSFVAGAYATNGAATGNTVTITGGTFSGNIHGGISINGVTSYNTINISDATDTLDLQDDAIRGGTTNYGSALYNTINITGTDTNLLDITGNSVTGGYAYSGLVSGNTVNLTNVMTTSDDDTYVYAGHSITSGNATNNTLTVTGGKYNGNAKLYGGSTDTGVASGNKVTVSGTTMTDTSVVGGETITGSAASNSVTISGENTFTDALIIGGESTGSGSASNNSVVVSVSDSTKFDGTILLGARSLGSGTVSNNTITINSGMYENDQTDNGYNTRISAGQSQSGISTGNITYIKGGTFKEGTIISGGYTISGTATKNIVYITGGTFDDGSIIVGGYAQSGTASSNTVSLGNGATYDGYIFGGYTQSGTVTGNNISITTNLTGTGIIAAAGTSSSFTTNTNNTITLGTSSSQTLSLDTLSLYGSYNTSTSLGLGEANTLIVKAITTTTGSISNFDKYIFYIDTVTDDTYRLNATSINLGTDATIVVYLSDKTYVFQPGDEIELFNTDSTASAVALSAITTIADTDKITGNIGTANVYQGLSLVTELSVKNNEENVRSLVVGATTANSLARTFPEARLASFAFVNQSDDLILGQGIASAIEITNLRLNEWVAFGAIDIGTSSYTTESDLTGDITFGGVSFVTGLSRKTPFGKSNLLTGLYLEAGTGFINTENFNEDLESVTTGGSSSYYGFGFFSRYDFGNGIYVGALARIGILATDFTTEDSMNLLEYSANTPYYGLGVSGGYQFNVRNNRDSIDMYGRYMWTQLAQKEMMIDSQNYDFDAINSHQLRVGGQYNFNHRRRMTPFVGVAAQYDFDGEARATVNNKYPTSTPQLQGLTGLFEVGVRFKPINSEDIPFSLSVNAEVFVGRREGFSATMDAEYSF